MLSWDGSKEMKVPWKQHLFAKEFKKKNVKQKFDITLYIIYMLFE